MASSAPVAAPAPRARLGSLRMVWRFASRYPGHLAAALAALLVTSAAPSSIP